MAIGSWAVQAAIYDLLLTAGIVGRRIFDADAVPPDVVFPYIAIGATEAIGADVIGRDGSNEFLPLHIWDRANREGGQRGGRNVGLIGDELHSLLNAKRLEVEGRDWAFCIVRDFLRTPDPDPLTTHAVLTLRVQHFGPRLV
jgi:hypothetical protein